MKKHGLKILGFGFHSYVDDFGRVKTKFMVGLRVLRKKNRHGYLITPCTNICKPPCLYGME